MVTQTKEKTEKRQKVKAAYLYKCRRCGNTLMQAYARESSVEDLMTQAMRTKDVHYNFHKCDGEETRGFCDLVGVVKVQ